MTTSRHIDGPVIVGSGLAALVTALECPRPSILITSGRFGCSGSTPLAQGGIAAAVAPDDSPAFHANDTHNAGAGLCDSQAVDALVNSAPAAITWLHEQGVHFDEQDGRAALGMEGAHSRARILHCDGDSTGAAIAQALVDAVRRTPRIRVIEHAWVNSLLHGPDGAVTGVRALAETTSGVSAPISITGSTVVLATGGYAGLFAHTTNPRSSWGSGVALAARAGANVRDLEMIQFHPTALALPGDPAQLVSEAVRGARARLVTTHGVPIMDDPLGARDVVARAVAQSWRNGDAVYLDTPISLGADFARRFPGIDAACRRHGLDPTIEPIPVRPAAHYSMGGIKVDLDGRTTVPGLWAVGECASTGVHGANRLASNSLLEAVVFGRRCAHDVAAIPSNASVPARALTASSPPERAQRPSRQLRQQVSEVLGLERDRLQVAQAAQEWAMRADTDDCYLVASLIARCAVQRAESVGAHQWADTTASAGTSVTGPAKDQPETTTLDTRLSNDAQVGISPERLAS